MGKKTHGKKAKWRVGSWVEVIAGDNAGKTFTVTSVFCGALDGVWYYMGYYCGKPLTITEKDLKDY